jgi:hypothetical protein
MAEADPVKQAKFERIRTLTRAWIIGLYTDSKGIFEWAKNIQTLLCSVIVEKGGIYVVVYSESGRLIFKFGMSFDCYRRVTEQPCKYAAKYMDLTQLKEIAPDELVQTILDMEMPGMVFHPDHVEQAQHLIRMQLVDTVLSCSAQCETNTISERLLQQPSSSVLAAVQPHTWLFTPDMIAFFRNIGKGKVNFLFSWRTLADALRVMLASGGSEFLRRRLQELPGFGKEFLGALW